jgi:nucleoid-associated protein YgaU
MKRISCLVILLALSAVPGARAQDAATEERLNKLSAQIEDLMGAKTEQDRRIAALAKEVESLRGQMERPTASAASPEDLKRVADAVREVDQKRLEDYEKIRVELQKLGKTLAATPPAPKKPNSPTTGANPPGPSTTSEKAGMQDKGFEYVIARGDTLSLIVKAYHDKKIPVTVDQILKANPGLKPDKLVVGKKIWIPAP